MFEDIYMHVVHLDASIVNNEMTEYSFLLKKKISMCVFMCVYREILNIS